MKIKGEVTSGLAKAAFFLSQDFYKNAFLEKCGFIPYPGTLNVVVSKNYLSSISQIKNECQNIIEPDEGFGAVKYIPAILNSEVEGAILFPDKTTHDENYLEFIAKDKLREKFNLSDGDEVVLSLII